jgi:hypothetical protein
MAKIETSNFKRLIGTWETEGTIFSDKGNLKLAGIDIYEFILGGNYILHKADVTMGDEKSETFEIISLEGSIDKATMHYYNSKAETGVMESSLTENNFKITGDKLKFEGTITDDNTRLFGKWHLQTDNNEWNEFIELKLTKQH